MRIRVLLALAALPLLAGCGGAASSGGSSPAHRALPTAAKPDVLQLADLGVGWVSDLGRTKTVGLKESMTGDAAGLRVLERKAYRGGYRAIFGRGPHVDLQSTAFTYASPQDARTVAAGWARGAPKVFPHLQQLTFPSPGLGADEWLWKSTTKGVPTYVVQWVHANVLAGVVTAGTRATVTEAVRLARTQEARIEGRPQLAPPLPGEAAKPAAQILTDAKAAVESASGTHLFEEAGGQRLDFHASRAAGYGTITRPEGVARVRRVGTRVWTNADRRLVAHSPNPAVAARFAGRWISIPSTSQGYYGTSSLTTLQFIAGMLQPAAESTTLAPTTLGVSRVHGRLVVVVVMQNHGGVGTGVYVPVRGTPYPIEIDQVPHTGAAVEHVLLDDWNVPFTVTPPKHPVSTARICACVT